MLINEKTGEISGKAKTEGVYTTAVRFYKEEIYSDKIIRILVEMPKCKLSVDGDYVFTETNKNTSVSLDCGFSEIGEFTGKCNDSKTPEWTNVDTSKCSNFLNYK